MAYIRVENAVKYFPREDGTDMLVLDGVSFDSQEFGITCLLGPSGCGKSTLLNIICGLERLDDGRVEVISNHRSPETRPPRLGYVFQDPRLLLTFARILSSSLAGRELARIRRKMGQTQSNQVCR